jgi:hypothetical protein
MDCCVGGEEESQDQNSRSFIPNQEVSHKPLDLSIESLRLIGRETTCFRMFSFLMGVWRNRSRDSGDHRPRLHISHPFLLAVCGVFHGHYLANKSEAQ